MSEEKIKKSLKEEFAKFLEEPSREKFRDFLKNNLGELENYDFKETWIDWTKLARHILALSNSQGGCIILGVKQKEDGTLEPIGLQELKDKSEIKKGIAKFIPEKLDYEIVDFSYPESEYEKIKGMKFQVVIVEDNPNYIPFICLSDGTNIRKGAIYIRNKTDSEEASYEKLQDIINRRIETSYSSKSENELEKNLAHLKVLYTMIPEYCNRFSVITPTIIRSVKNPRYPEESFEDFILKMIELKKRIIESIVRGVP